MSTKPSDPLLRGTRLLLVILMALAALAAVGLAIVIPAMFLAPDNVHVVVGDGTTASTASGALAALLAVVIVILVLALLFLRKLIAVIDSVKLGSPFVPDNARRLRTMAWLALSMEVIGLLAEPLQAFVATRTPEADLEVSFSFTGFIIALLLFILARVFEHGTRLAEDVEGTV